MLSACSNEPTQTSPRPSPSVSAIEWQSGKPCPEDPSLGADEGCRSFDTGDIDGDGNVDEVEVVAELAEDRLPVAWQLRVDSRGSLVSVPLGPGHDFSYPELIGTTDAEGDGRDEIFIKVFEHIYHSGGAPVVGIFRFSERGLVRVRERGRGVLNIDIGGVSHFGQGLRCEDRNGDARAELVLTRIDSATSPRPRWSETIYRWRGSEVIRVGTRSGRIERQGYTDPDVYAFYQLQCNEIDPPFPY